MKISSKGQVTIPAHIRRKMGLLPHTSVEFVIQRGQLVLRKSRAGSARGERLIELMRGRATGKLSTDEIMRVTRGE